MFKMANSIDDVRRLYIERDATQVAERPASYLASEDEDAIIQKALAILCDRMRVGEKMVSPTHMKDLLRLRMGSLPFEVFSIAFFDAQMRFIDYVELFRGTVCSTSVHPREVVRAAMQLNASHVVLAHNHPSGETNPSAPDLAITKQLEKALELVDTRLVDHLIVGRSHVYSMAEHGLI